MMTEAILAVGYGCTAALWATYAVQQQIRLHGWSWRVAVVFMLNAALCPVAICAAILNSQLGLNKRRNPTMSKYEVSGYDKRTGEKKTIVVEAPTTRNAKTQAYDYLTYPKVLGKVR